MSELTVSLAFERALQHHQAGRLTEAEALYRQILAVDPNQPEALHYLGVIAHQVGCQAEAIELIDRALAIRPRWAEALSNQGEVFRAQGQIEAALHCFKQAVEIAPDFPLALSNLGNALTEAGHAEEAIAYCRRAIAINPRQGYGWQNLANALHAKGHVDEAIGACRRAIELDPGNSYAHNLLGVALLDLEQLPEALAEFQQALKINPEFSDAYNNLGVTYQALGQLEESIAACHRALELNPKYCEAYYNLGNALKEQGRIAEAISSFRQALALKPDYAAAHCNLGNAFQDQGDLDSAILQHQQAIKINPQFALAYSNLGNVLRIKGQHEAALAAHRQAIALNPAVAEVQRNFGNTLQTTGQVDEAIVAYEQALRIKPRFADALCDLGNALKDKGQLDAAMQAYRQSIPHEVKRSIAYSNYLLTHYYSPNSDAATITAELARWQEQHAAPLSSEIRPHFNDRNPERRLRIGYVSPDLRNHPVGHFLLPLLEHHDRQQHEIFAYAQVTAPDALTEQLRGHTDHWLSTVGLSDAQLAARIRADQIDILVDLAMHTANNRLLVFARKPAPVQVNYLAYVGSSGLTTMDYRLSDPYLDPPGHDEAGYCEQTVRLPETYWCYRPPEQALLPPRREQPPDTIWFGCLNNYCKINPPLVAMWAKILGGVPHARLLVHAFEGDHRQELLDCFAEHGIVPARVEFVGRMPRAVYFQTYHSLDITLDTTPYSGGTTTCDSLWMGVPVVTLAGERAVGRGGVSLLNNVGLPELIAKTDEEYIQIAVALAHDWPRLQKLHATLRERMQASPLMNAPNFTRHVEKAYRNMWHAWCRNRGDEHHT